MQDQCIESYARLKSLKLVGDELGIKWQSVYVHLKKAGVKVTGDKARYGNAKDRLASAAERRFSVSVPIANDLNQEKYQSSIDFEVQGWMVDVKASRLRANNGEAPRWSFCINKQKDAADFFVFYSYESEGDSVRHVFLMPREIAVNSSLVSIPESLKSKWADYMVEEEGLYEFFIAMGQKPPSKAS